MDFSQPEEQLIEVVEWVRGVNKQNDSIELIG